MRQLPNSVIGLIEELEAAYPPRCIQPDESPELAHRYAGNVEVVEKLRARYDAGMRMERKDLPKVIR